MRRVRPYWSSNPRRIPENELSVKITIFYHHLTIVIFRTHQRRSLQTKIFHHLYLLCLSGYEKHRRNEFRIYIKIRGTIVSRSAVHPILFRFRKWELSAYWTDKVVTRSTWVECLSRTGKYGTASEQPCFSRATIHPTAPSQTSSNYSSSSVFIQRPI